MYENRELLKSCYKLLNELFRLQPGETVAITCDTYSDPQIVDAAMTAAYLLGGIPLLLKQIAPRDGGKVGDPDMAVNSLVAALTNADVWLSFNYQWMLYTTVYDRVHAAEKRPRYICLDGDQTPETMIRNIGKVDFPLLIEFLEKMGKAHETARHFHITTPAGTDLSFELYDNVFICVADGRIYEKGASSMLPGQITFQPDYDTINGTMVIDGSLLPFGILKKPVTFTIEKGFITKIEGDDPEAKKIADWFASFDHPNMYHCAHISYGFGPYAKLTGCTLEDERVWGCTEWGFGSFPSDGRTKQGRGVDAPSHTDGINLNTSLWMDGVQVLDEGRVVGPTAEIVELARKLGK